MITPTQRTMGVLPTSLVASDCTPVWGLGSATLQDGKDGAAVWQATPLRAASLRWRLAHAGEA
jgi:hypothetical protein